MFPKMHLNHVINDDHQNHQKLLFLPNARPWEFRTIDCETPKDGFTASRPLPFKVGPRQKLSIVTSLHGMICVLLTKPRMLFEYSDLILWNPVTGDYKTLSKAGSHKDCYKIYGHQFGFYYSSTEDDYKLVCVTRHPNAYIYSLKSDSWRKVESSVFLNENPSFMFEFEQLLASKSYSIMTSDTKMSEKLRDVATPPYKNQRTDCMGFMIVRGCIHFCVAIINSVGRYDTIELWRINRYGDWDKVVTSSREEHLSCIDQPLHVMRNGNWLMHSKLKEYVYVLDTKKHTEHIMCSIRMSFKPAGKYMETIVSPNQYMN